MGKIIKNGIEYSGAVDKKGGVAVYVTTPEVTAFTPSVAWTDINKTSQVVELEPNTNYSVIASAAFTEGTGEFRLKLTPEGGSTKTQASYNASGHTMSVSAVTNITTGSTGNVTVQTSFRGEKAGTRWSPWNIQFIPVSVPIENPEHIYSTAEQEVGIWVNGKTIYKKTIAFGTFPNATSKSVEHGISDLDYVVKIEGTCLQGEICRNVPLMYKGSDSAYNVELYVNKTQVRAVASQDRSMIECPYVTIYYTKN